jgi:very-short-patch-repair endonuclease
MGIPHEIEYLTQDNLFSMDIALRGRKVAIEVDGPSHFCANMRSERLGSDRLRERFLAHKGWNVSVLIFPFDFLDSARFFRRRGDAKTFG